MKKLLSFVLACCLCGNAALISTIHANENIEEVDESKITQELVWHDVDEIATMPYSETYSYEELKQSLLYHGYSPTETAQIIGEKPATTRAAGAIRYNLMYLNTYNYGGYKLQARFTAGLYYEDGNPVGQPDKIVSLEGAHIYTGSGSKCVFNGTIFYRLEAGNRFYYNFYGDIYKAGQMQWNTSISVGIKQAASVSASFSNGDGFVKNVSESETYRNSTLKP